MIPLGKGTIEGLENVGLLDLDDLEEGELQECVEAIELAFNDVDPRDRNAINQRVSEVLQALCNGTFY